MKLTGVEVRFHVQMLSYLEDTECSVTRDAVQCLTLAEIVEHDLTAV